MSSCGTNWETRLPRPRYRKKLDISQISSRFLKHILFFFPFQVRDTHSNLANEASLERKKREFPTLPISEKRRLFGGSERRRRIKKFQAPLGTWLGTFFFFLRRRDSLAWSSFERDKIPAWNPFFLEFAQFQRKIRRKCHSKKKH